MPETEIQLIEDLGIYIILIVMLVNMFIMIRWMHKQSKKTDTIYNFIEKLSKQDKEK